MSIYTPHGLKIRISINYAFALMARLYPKVDAFKVLKTTEGLTDILPMLAFVVGVISFYFRLDPYQIGLYTFLVSVVGGIITTFGFFVIPGLPKLGTLYSYISVLGILFVALVAYGFFSVGWQGVVAFLIGRILAGIINTGIGFLQSKQIYSKSGLVVTTSEINFYNAYRLHASATGKSTDISVSDDELKEENWIECYKDLATKWPEVVQRFENY